MLFKLSFSNMKKSLKDYAVYFFTLILGVAIFYLFNAIETQTTMLKISEETREIVKLINTTLSGVSVFVAFILGFLVIYASNFLMKKRKKEFALYILLGMGKRKISLILGRGAPGAGGDSGSSGNGQRWESQAHQQWI